MDAPAVAWQGQAGGWDETLTITASPSQPPRLVQLEVRAGGGDGWSPLGRLEFRGPSDPGRPGADAQQRKVVALASLRPAARAALRLPSAASPSNTELLSLARAELRVVVLSCWGRSQSFMALQKTVMGVELEPDDPERGDDGGESSTFTAAGSAATISGMRLGLPRPASFSSSFASSPGSHLAPRGESGARVTGSLRSSEAARHGTCGVSGSATSRVRELSHPRDLSRSKSERADGAVPSSVASAAAAAAAAAQAAGDGVREVPGTVHLWDHGGGTIAVGTLPSGGRSGEVSPGWRPGGRTVARAPSVASTADSFAVSAATPTSPGDRADSRLAPSAASSGRNPRALAAAGDDSTPVSGGGRSIRVGRGRIPRSHMPPSVASSLGESSLGGLALLSGPSGGAYDEEDSDLGDTPRGQLSGQLSEWIEDERRDAAGAAGTLPLPLQVGGAGASAPGSPRAAVALPPSAVRLVAGVFGAEAAASLAGRADSPARAVGPLGPPSATRGAERARAAAASAFHHEAWATAPVRALRASTSLALALLGRRDDADIEAGAVLAAGLACGRVPDPVGLDTASHALPPGAADDAERLHPAVRRATAASCPAAAAMGRVPAAQAATAIDLAARSIAGVLAAAGGSARLRGGTAECCRSALRVLEAAQASCAQQGGPAGHEPRRGQLSVAERAGRRGSETGAGRDMTMRSQSSEGAERDGRTGTGVERARQGSRRKLAMKQRLPRLRVADPSSAVAGTRTRSQSHDIAAIGGGGVHGLVVGGGGGTDGEASAVPASASWAGARIHSTPGLASGPALPAGGSHGAGIASARPGVAVGLGVDVASRPATPNVSSGPSPATAGAAGSGRARFMSFGSARAAAGASPRANVGLSVRSGGVAGQVHLSPQAQGRRAPTVSSSPSVARSPLTGTSADSRAHAAASRGPGTERKVSSTPSVTPVLLPGMPPALPASQPLPPAAEFGGISGVGVVGSDGDVSRSLSSASGVDVTEGAGALHTAAAAGPRHEVTSVSGRTSVISGVRGHVSPRPGSVGSRSVQATSSDSSIVPRGGSAMRNTEGDWMEGGPGAAGTGMEVQSRTASRPQPGIPAATDATTYRRAGQPGPRSGSLAAEGKQGSSASGQQALVLSARPAGSTSVSRRDSGAISARPVEVKASGGSCCAMM